MIRTKEEFNALSRTGRLGNFLRSWGSLEQLWDSGYQGYLTIRHRQPQSPHFIPVSQTCCVVSHAALLEQAGARPEDMYFTEIPHPDTLRVMNFEAMLSERGVELYYEFNTTNPVRGIRERGTYASGLVAQGVLELLSPASYEMVAEIWRKHPTAVIEATEFTQPCGVFGRELIVWEVRDF